MLNPYKIKVNSMLSWSALKLSCRLKGSWSWNDVHLNIVPIIKKRKIKRKIPIPAINS